ncbi:MAG: SBBP repeat-containing protein, partial [Flavobacteriales bacterium]|nr:SBBP repeat-containing protein [Flavobacteriales bacterium]
MLNSRLNTSFPNRFHSHCLILVVLIIACFIHKSHAQTLNWAHQIGDSILQQSYSIAVDDSGYVLVGGDFNGTVDFDPDTGIQYLTSGLFNDAFIAKYDSTGKYVWAGVLLGANSQSTSRAWDIAIDDSGNVHVVGQFEGTVDFDPGPGVSSMTSNGNKDIFFAKYTSGGTLIWVHGLGNNLLNVGTSIGIDSFGNVYITGWCAGAMDFDPWGGNAYFSNSGSYDTFLAKYDMNGDYVWAKYLGSIGLDIGYDLKVDKNNNVYIGGHIDRDTDFDTSSVAGNLVVNGIQDLLLVKYDENGNFIWGNNMGGGAGESLKGMAIDDSMNVYFVGTYRDSVDMDPDTNNQVMLLSKGGNDSYIAKFDSNGDFVWANNFGGIGPDYFESIVVNDDGNLFITGFISDTVDMNPGIPINQHISSGSQDIVLAKFDNNGNYIWSYHTGGSNTDVGVELALGNSGSILVTGYFGDTVSFDPSGVADSLISIAPVDIFVVSYEDQINSYSIIFETACDFYSSPSALYSWVISGVYQDTIPNSAGGDSIITVNLTIFYSSSDSVSVTSCDSYTTPLGMTLTTSGIYSDTLSSSVGCDSVVTVDLTINYSSTSTDVINACDSITWIDGNTYVVSNNSATQALTNAAGCDSVVTLNLTVNGANGSTLTETACDSYVFGGNTLTSSGTYYDTLTNVLGCDSVVTLNLTLNSTSTSTLTETACDSYDFGGNTLTTSGTYYDTLSTMSGCDSVVTLDLTINTVDASLNQNGIILSANTGGAAYQRLDCDNN